MGTPQSLSTWLVLLDDKTCRFTYTPVASEGPSLVSSAIRSSQKKAIEAYVTVELY
jgi:hypothetical protein